MRPTAVHHRASMACWFAVGALLVVGVLGILTIGAPLLALGVLLAVVLTSRGHPGTRWLAPLGAGATLVVVGLLHTPYRPCSGAAQTLAPGQRGIECGGHDPTVYIASGALMICGAVAAHALSRRVRV